MPNNVQTICSQRAPEETPLHQADATRVAHFGSKFLSMERSGSVVERWREVHSGQTERCVRDPLRGTVIQPFPHWSSKSRVKGDRWTEVSSKSRRRGRRECKVRQSSRQTKSETSTRSRMRRFAAGARRVWQDVRQKIPQTISNCSSKDQVCSRSGAQDTVKKKHEESTCQDQADRTLAEEDTTAHGLRALSNIRPP